MSDEMYFEVWIDLSKKREVEKKLMDICEEIYPVFYDYHYIVKIKGEVFESIQKIDGVKLVRRHYNC